MTKKIRTTFILLGGLAIGQVIWWAYLLTTQQDRIAYISPEAAEKSERFKTMILFEGGFFIFFWAFCLFLIYRSYYEQLSLKATKDNFLGAITHEIKTPIANVQLCLETLQRPQIDEEKKQSYLQKALKALSQLNSLVENILTLTAVTNFNNKNSKLSLHQLTEQVLDKIEFDPQTCKVELLISEDHHVQANPMASELILKNIFENSFKYSQNKSAHIVVSSIKKRNFIQLEIKDHGIGLQPNEVEQVFVPFWRSDRAIQEAKPGTGIGLTLASELARKNNMTLTAASLGQNQGATFTITWRQA